MAVSFLDFEQPIAELEAKIEELGHVTSDSEVNIGDEIARLRAKSRALTRSIFANLTPWQITQLARHPQRPYTLDYLASIFTDFQELHGDRMYADDMAIVGGPARLEGHPVMVIGHQKGRDTKERVRRNYGMPKPEGYRKALRLMKMAERFGLPLITLIDTPGAYPGVGSEERGQSEAIARNLFEMSALKVPIVSIVIGEGGSGGALAIGVCDRLLMLQFSTYSVISPEGCASILWKSADKKEVAAEALNLTAERLGALGLVDEALAAGIFGYRNAKTLEYAEKLGLAFQLTNIIRDVGEDARKNRIYLPMDELKEYGVTAADILNASHTESFVRLMRFQAERARRCYDEALALLPSEDRHAQRPGLMMAAIYRALLDEIAGDNYRVLDQRTALTPIRKLWIAWRTWVTA